jgi:uncharacterized protein YjbJ (UPF0337 family)
MEDVEGAMQSPLSLYLPIGRLLQKCRPHAEQGLLATRCRMSPLMEVGMGSFKGKIDTAVGKAKEKVGYAVGSDKLQAKGAAQALKGKAESAVTEKLDKARKAVDKGVQKL